MRPNRPSGFSVWVSRLLILFGMACVLYYIFTTVNTWRYQREAKIRLEEMVTMERPPDMQEPPDVQAPPPGRQRSPQTRRMPPAAAKPLKRGALIGRVDIPRLNVSAAVAEGDDKKILGRAVGHLPDTPLPWHRRGNVAIAAHRDGLFRPLEQIQINDKVSLITPHGDFHYRVKRKQIVNPDDVWVLAPTAKPTITLITCYPFSFVGRAPRRFIVQAELVGHVAGSVLTGSVAQ